MAWLSAGKQSSTCDGFEMHMGTNYLGPFLLSMLLLPVLQRTAQVPPQHVLAMHYIMTLAPPIITTFAELASMCVQAALCLPIAQIMNDALLRVVVSITTLMQCNVCHSR